jgi:hypothetical protein
MFTLDMWRCLARLGVSVNYLATAVVAARKKDDLHYAERLRCMEGGLVIPNRLGGEFGYSVGRYIRFSSEELEDEASCKEAIAIYIKTMRMGLKNAVAVQANISNNAGPISLCCCPPRRDLQLLASPIPHAQRSSGMRINQGELYKFDPSPFRLIPWLKDLERKPNHVVVFDWMQLGMRPYTVKVSCPTVHSTFVNPGKFWVALTTIHSKGSWMLKYEISRTLAACAYVNRRCVVTVMTNLSRADGTNLIVSPALLDSRLHLWNAFATLVKNVLIPMASLDIIHTDIRFDPNSLCVYNILGTRNWWGGTELWLIDFESLLDCTTHTRRTEPQDYAISMTHFFVDPRDLAWSFLFWQVLWAAYVWSPTRCEPLCNAWTFVQTFLLHKESFQPFKAAIGTANLAKIHEAEHDHDVSKLLGILCDLYIHE